MVEALPSHQQRAAASGRCTRAENTGDIGLKKKMNTGHKANPWALSIINQAKIITASKRKIAYPTQSSVRTAV